MYKEETRTWYEWDYCGVKLELNKNHKYYDNVFLYWNTVDICNSPKCYKRHIEKVKSELKENGNFMLWILDECCDKLIESYEYDKKKEKFKIEWQNDIGNIHYYKEDSTMLINKVMEYYKENMIKEYRGEL